MRCLASNDTQLDEEGEDIQLRGKRKSEGMDIRSWTYEVNLETSSMLVSPRKTELGRSYIDIQEKLLMPRIDPDARMIIQRE